MAIVEALNALGVALSANPTSSRGQQEVGSRLTIAGLAIQLIVIIIFIVLAAIFHRRCAKGKIRSRAISTPLLILYISMSLILIRCIYRLVEHTGNTKVQLGNFESLLALSPILRYEWYFYVFDATLMLVNSVLWNVWNPGRYLPMSHHIYLGQNGIELQGEPRPDDRSVAAKIASISTFGLLFRRKKGHQLGEADDHALENS